MAEAPLVETPAEIPAETDDSRHGYVVVARRYRPQTFANVVGQEQVVRALTNAIKQNRVAHAYLFTGARGVGKTSTARILAKALNCQRGMSITPCNECESCRSISTGDDVDVLEIDGASNRGIDEMRQLRQNAGVRPIHSRFKIYIIDEVHMLTKEAFNALLKTLEEPPEHVKFIFCTTEAEKIPITILSRCQRFDFSSIQTVQIADLLLDIVKREGFEIEPEAVQMLARRAGGSMRDSQSLLDQLLAFGGKQLTAADVHALLGTADDARIAALLEKVVARDPAGALSEIDKALQEGVDLGQLVDQVLGYLRDVMVAAVGGTPDAFIFSSPAHAGQLSIAAKALGLETVLAMLQILAETKSRLRYSTQGRILLELALVRCCRLEQLDDLPNLIAQLRSGALPAATSGRPVPSVSRTVSVANPETAVRQTVVQQTAERTSAEPAAAPVRPARSAPEAVEEVGKKNESAPVIPVVTGAKTPSNGPLPTSEQAQEIWQQVLAQLSPTLAAYATYGQEVAIRAPNRLVISFPAQYNFQRKYLERPERMAELNQIVAAVAGLPLLLELQSCTAEPAAKGPPAQATVVEVAAVRNTVTTTISTAVTAAGPGTSVRPSSPAPVAKPVETAPVVRPPIVHMTAPPEVLERPLLKRAMELFACRVLRFEEPAAPVPALAGGSGDRDE